MPVLIIVIVALIFLAFFTFFTVAQQTFKVVERFGKFNKICTPGLNIKIPFIDWVAGKDTFRIQQLDVPVETKTKDNVFVNVKVSVQYHIIKEKAYEAFYKLESPEPQITSYVFDVVRANVPTLDLDDVFEKKEEIASAIKRELKETMDDFGYLIVQALVTDIDPDAKVKESMNEINAQRRLRIAAAEKGEADKILRVKEAEAEAESKKLQGQGIAEQRKAIVDGLKDSVEAFSQAVEGSTAQDVMSLVLMTQYFDMLKDVGGSSQSNVIMIPSSPGGMDGISQEIIKAITASSKIG
jgi:regulator of protease activity HflC (stomatin/prohibitin superfamily)